MTSTMTLLSSVNMMTLVKVTSLATLFSRELLNNSRVPILMKVKVGITRSNNAIWVATCRPCKALLSLMIRTSIQNLIYLRLLERFLSRLLTMILGQASIQSLILLLHLETGSETINMTQVAPMMRKREA